MSPSPDPARVLWPALMVGALLLGGLTFAPWGYGDEGVEPTINGLGEVTVPGATAEDVAILQEHTLRPGLLVLGIAALVLVAAVVAWWRPSGRERARSGTGRDAEDDVSRGRTDPLFALCGAAICGFGGLLAVLIGLRVVVDPSTRLFSAEILDLVGEVDGSILNPSWGAYATVVVGILITGTAAAAAARLRLREGSRTLR